MSFFDKVLFNLLLEEVNKVKGKSLFDVNDVHQIIKQDLNAGKAFVMKKAKSAHDDKKLTDKGFATITSMVNVAKNAENLATRIMDFILKHPSEGLGVVNIEKERKEAKVKKK